MCKVSMVVCWMMSFGDAAKNVSYAAVAVADENVGCLVAIQTLAFSTGYQT